MDVGRGLKNNVCLSLIHVPFRIRCHADFFGQTYARRSSGKFEPLAFCLLRSLKVIGTDTGRRGTYEFLLTFHSTFHSSIYRLRETARYWLKTGIFSQLKSISGPWSWNLVMPDGLANYNDRDIRLRKGMTLSSAVFHTIAECDGQTDRRTHDDG